MIDNSPIDDNQRPNSVEEKIKIQGESTTVQLRAVDEQGEVTIPSQAFIDISLWLVKKIITLPIASITITISGTTKQIFIEYENFKTAAHKITTGEQVKRMRNVFDTFGLEISTIEFTQYLPEVKEIYKKRLLEKLDQRLKSFL